MKKKILFIILIIILLIPTIVFAHSGRTDSSGGHYNSSTGDYHYHHGYSEHYHYKGLCPYIDDEEDFLPQKCPSCEATINPANGFYCFECSTNLLPSGIMLISKVDGDATKTRNEYYREVKSLEYDVDVKQNLLDKKQNTINNLLEQNEELNTKMFGWHIVYISIAILLIVYICYLKYIKKGEKNNGK